jgi:hypothetical protein
LGEDGFERENESQKARPDPQQGTYAKGEASYYMYWPIDDYSVNDILLDIKNIRIPTLYTAQDAVLQDLFSNEDTFSLVKSIVQNGLFPDEFPILIKENGKLIVIEGNRRIAALKALDDPNRVPFFKDKIKALKNPKIQKVRAVLAPNRDKATSLIANKHTINFLRPWKPLRQAYFYKSQLDNGKTIIELKQEYPEHDITKFIKMLEAHHLAKSITYDNDAVTLLVHDERKFPITNLERMYEDTYVSDYLGLSFDKNGKIKGNVRADEFKKAYKRIIEDVALGEIDSRKYNSKSQREKYIDSLPKELEPSKGGKVSFTTQTFKENKIDKAALGKSVRSNRRQKGLIPSYVPFKLENSSLKEIYVELRGINVADFPNATHDLLRSFLECSLIYYLKETDEYKFVKNDERHNPKLSEMLAFILSDRCKSITDKNLKQVIEHVRQGYNQPYSLARMNMINHNENWASNEKEVRSAWNKLEPLMKYLLNPKK